MASSYRNIHPVDEILSNLVAEAVQSDASLIADKVCENIKVPPRSGTLLLETSRNSVSSTHLTLPTNRQVELTRSVFYL